MAEKKTCGANLGFENQLWAAAFGKLIDDEAHRSQYGFIKGFARCHMHNALPNASFIGFTATPIERDGRSTPTVFDDYIDIYDILRAIEVLCKEWVS